MTDFVALIRERSAPLEALPTGTEPRVAALEGVRAVLFDVYGTLVISGSGDVGVNAAAGRGDAFVSSLQAVGLPATVDGEIGVEALNAAIRDDHAAKRDLRIEYPEVDITEIWRNALGVLGVEPPERNDLLRLTIEYECRVNPTWTMPHAAEVVKAIAGRGLLLGIVSNAQWFTPLVVRAHLGLNMARGSLFAEDVMVWSYECRRAKPGTYLYECAAAKLKSHGIEPHEVLYVGNDLLNDCTPAQQMGFRTALFAGDERSLRLREGDERVANTRPTVTVTDLRQLLDCLPAVETAADHG
ncbi:HAD family hydrolase [Alienimonas chondri]|uniref:HAD family hydrolase n=1 Tax=Alienimonas chondri TaxID=2681879 RepID=A0ABX1VBB3_9PLAN|nr:HAD family hydrolase [Alienimonas chondri]NNJ24711.1 hypothetical protein [Alienimonas chondri]